jgi:hypothetical protein
MELHLNNKILLVPSGAGHEFIEVDFPVAVLVKVRKEGQQLLDVDALTKVSTQSDK